MTRFRSFHAALFCTFMTTTAFAQSDSAFGPIPVADQVGVTAVSADSGTTDSSHRVIQFTIHYIVVPPTLRESPEFHSLIDGDESPDSPIIKRDLVETTDLSWLSKEDSARLMQIVEGHDPVKVLGPVKMAIPTGRTGQLICSDENAAGFLKQPVTTTRKPTAKDTGYAPLRLTMTATPTAADVLACRYEIEQIRDSSPRPTSDKPLHRLRLKTSGLNGQTLLIHGWNESRKNNGADEKASDVLLLITAEIVEAPVP